METPPVNSKSTLILLWLAALLGDVLYFISPYIELSIAFILIFLMVRSMPACSDYLKPSFRRFRDSYLLYVALVVGSSCGFLYADAHPDHVLLYVFSPAVLYFTKSVFVISTLIAIFSVIRVRSKLAV